MMKKLKRYQTVIIVALFGSIIAWTSLVFIQSYEHQRLQSQFSNTFSDKITGLSRAILAIEKILIATQRLVQIQQQVTRDDFQLLINENLLINTGMLGVQWVPIIDRSQLSEFETHIQQSGAFDYRIAPIVPTKRCHDRFTDKLLPIAFSEPQDEIGDELGVVTSMQIVPY